MSALPQQESRQTDFAACTDDEVDIRNSDRVEMLVDRRRRDFVDDCVQIRALSDPLANEITDRVGDLLAAAAGRAANVITPIFPAIS
jgi:hypothetical protein